jgi:hypothetical protein
MVVDNFIHVIVQNHIRPGRILSLGKSGNEVLLYKYKNGCLAEGARIYPSTEDMHRWMRAHVVGSDGMFYMPKQGLKVFAFDATEHKEKEATIKSVLESLDKNIIAYEKQRVLLHTPKMLYNAEIVEINGFFA